MSEAPYKVSIVIPVYNGADFLDEAIRSALAQTHRNIEVIVVNDGSDDGGATERIALRYGSRIRYFSKQNGGVASALNYAIREMSGDYFSWLSHDDLYSEDKVERDIAALMAIRAEQRERTVIYSDYAVFSSDPEKSIPVRLKGVAPEGFRHWLALENSLHGCTLLIPRTAFAECGVFNEALRTTQDFDLWFRMAKRYRFVHIPEVLVKARSHPEQGSRKMAGAALAECNALLSQFTLELSDSELRAAGKRLPEAYAEISASLWRRGFLPAGRVAARLALRHREKGFFQDTLPALWTIGRGMAEYQVLRPARRLISAPLRLMIKTLLSSIKRAVSPRRISFESRSLQGKFSEIYEKNIFGGRASRSGEGSDLVQTEVIRSELPALVKKLGIRTFLDAPCGDWYWMQHTNLGVEHYIGVDIVAALVERNQEKFGNASTSFRCLNLAQDELPAADLIFSRDCLVHLSFDDARRILANFKRTGAKYLLTTTFVERKKNSDLTGKHSFWRPLNMQLPPFNFPPPLQLINEKCTEEHGQYLDKCLGLWLLKDLP